MLLAIARIYSFDTLSPYFSACLYCEDQVCTRSLVMPVISVRLSFSSARINVYTELWTIHLPTENCLEIGLCLVLQKQPGWLSQ